MAIQNIDNTPAGSGLGDTLYVAFSKVNAMMVELYNADASFEDSLALVNTALESLNDGSTLNHQHTIANIIGLQTLLNSKVSTSTYNAQISSINSSIQVINETLSTIIDILNTKVEEAPIDSLTYGRRNNDWVEIATAAIPTNTSDLINDGEDGVHPYITLLDLPSNLILYPTTGSSDISGYAKLVTDIHDPEYNVTAVDVSTGVVSGSNQLISSLVTVPDLISGNPGVFNISTIGNIRRSAGSGTAEFYFNVYKRDSLGTETLIGVSNPTLPVNNGVYAEFSATAIWDDGSWTLTDKIVIKYYTNRIAGGSNPTYEFQFGGLTPVRTLVPIPLSVVPVLTIDATPTSGSANAVQSGGVFDALALKVNSSTATTGSVITFDTAKIFNTFTTPTTADITNDLTGAKIGVVQKIYSNKSVEPTYPLGWVKIGGDYTTSVVNIIYAEWSEGSRVEYWIIKG